MKKRTALFTLSAALTLSGWALWLLWAWLNRFADSSRLTGYHWTAFPMGAAVLFLLVFAAVVALYTCLEVKG